MCDGERERGKKVIFVLSITPPKKMRNKKDSNFNKGNSCVSLPRRAKKNLDEILFGGGEEKSRESGGA